MRNGLELVDGLGVQTLDECSKTEGICNEIECNLNIPDFHKTPALSIWGHFRLK